MSGTHVKVYEVDEAPRAIGPIANPPAKPPSPPRAVPGFLVTGDGDLAKRQAREHLVRQGLTVRSLSWSPGDKGDLLVAYVIKAAK